MERGLVTLIGMSIAYVASFVGMGLAWWAWKRRLAGDAADAGPSSGGGSPAPPPAHPAEPAPRSPKPSNGGEA